MGHVRMAFALTLALSGCGSGGAQGVAHNDARGAANDDARGAANDDARRAAAEDAVPAPADAVAAPLAEPPLGPVHLELELRSAELGPGDRLEGSVYVMNNGGTPVDHVFPARHSGELGWRILGEDGSVWSIVFHAPPPPIPGDGATQGYSVQPGARGYLGRLELVGGFSRGEQARNPAQDRLPSGRYRIVATSRVGTMELRSAAIVFVVR